MLHARFNDIGTSNSTRMDVLHMPVGLLHVPKVGLLQGQGQAEHFPYALSFLPLRC